MLAGLEEMTLVEIGPGGESGHVRSVAQVYEAGHMLDFTGLFAGEARRRISVPGYPFQRRSFLVQHDVTADRAKRAR